MDRFGLVTFYLQYNPRASSDLDDRFAAKNWRYVLVV